MKVPAEVVCMPPHEGRFMVHEGSMNLGAKQPMMAATAPPPTHACMAVQPQAVIALERVGM